MRIGKSRTPNVGEEIKIYNAMDDKYWTGLIEYIEDDMLTVEIYGEAAGSYPVKFNDKFME